MLRIHVLFTLLLVAAAPLYVEASRPPDVVLFLSDDQTWFDIGCYGSADAVTPNIDALAGQGMRFTHCFTSTPMCAPTRQQLYTGLWPVRNGAYPNHSRVYDGVLSLAQHFESLGYRVALAGKQHFNPRASFPFEILLGGVAHDGGNRKAQDFSLDGVARFINRDADQPYFLICASNQPHTPWNRGDASAFDANALTLPPYVVDNTTTRQALTKYLAEITYMDDLLGQVMARIDAAGRADNTITIFTSEQGSTMPFGKWTCYDAGLRTALVVRWPGRIEPGSTTDAMVQYVDVVPTLLAAAGADPMSLDVGIGGAPEAAGNPNGFDGRSFLPVLLGQADAHRQYTFGVHTTRGIIHGNESYPIRSVRDARYKLIRNLAHDQPFSNLATRGEIWDSWLASARQGDEHAAAMVDRYVNRPAVELYDLEEDPFELNNLADNPYYSDVIRTLDAELSRWMAQQGDTGVGTEMLAKERQGKGGGE